MNRSTSSDTTRPAAGPRIRMRQIGKRFGAVPVLRGVSFEIRPGEVHVLAGENGAGKSTLIKILGGVHHDFSGTLELDGRLIRPRSPQEANALGIAVIFQELSLVPSLSVVDNIFLGRSLTRWGMVDDRLQKKRAYALLERLEIPLPMDQRAGDLSIAQQQLVEIAKALAQDVQVLIMDEPTSALTAPEVEHLFDRNSGIYMNSEEHGAAWERPASVGIKTADQACS